MVIMYKNGFGQAHCVDLLKRIHRNFTLHFRSFNLLSIIFKSLKEFLGLFK
jgi:hypothetical protein